MCSDGAERVHLLLLQLHGTDYHLASTSDGQIILWNFLFYDGWFNLLPNRFVQKYFFNDTFFAICIFFLQFRDLPLPSIILMHTLYCNMGCLKFHTKNSALDLRISTQVWCEPQRQSQIHRNLRGGQIWMLWWTRWPRQRTNFTYELCWEKVFFLFHIQHSNLRKIIATPSPLKVKRRRNRKKNGWKQKFAVFLGWLISLLIVN